MLPFPIDRRHPPRRIACSQGGLHLVLRPWSLSDVDALLEAVNASLPELRAFMPWAHLPLSREGEYDLIAKFSADYWAGREYVFGLLDESGAIAGSAGLHPRTPLNPQALEVGYWIATARAGRGYATLACKVLVALAFDRFACERLQVMHDEANVASRRVIEKCGFAYEGTVRNAMAEVPREHRAAGFRGTPNHRLYALVPEDLSRLGWLPAIRAAMTVEPAL